MNSLRRSLVPWPQCPSSLSEMSGPRKLAIYGSTGSIGESILDVARQCPEAFSIEALFCGSQVEKLVEQAKAFRPKVVGVARKDAFEQLKKAIREFDSKIEVICGESDLTSYAGSGDYDIQIAGIVGFAGLRSVAEGLEHGKVVALANKESLVAAGNQMCLLIEKSETAIFLPLDSEHSALFQSLQGISASDVERLMLTASGGPFLHHTKEELKSITVEQALKHPNWDMGPKVSIDSATMVNKALEVIEAYWLFGFDADQIDVIVHPESVVHSQVSLHDSTYIAQLSQPDMRAQMAYSIQYPLGRVSLDSQRLDYTKPLSLQFYPLDEDKFKAVALAKRCLELGGNASVIFTVANEVAVEMFVKQELSFLGIIPFIESALEKHYSKEELSLDEVFLFTNELIKKIR